MPGQGLAAGTVSPVLGGPPRALRSRAVNLGAKAPGLGKGTTALGKSTRAPRATGLDEARHTTQRHGARQGGTPSATTKAHGQVPSNNGQRVPQPRTARTTHNEPRHANRCQATQAAVQMDVCAPGSEPSPCRLRNSRRPDGRARARQRTQPLPGTKQPTSGWTCARPEGTQFLPATYSRCPDGRVRAPQRHPAHATQHTKRAHR